MATPFKTGDSVQLKSGGPEMTLGPTIESHDDTSQVECVWFVKKEGEPWVQHKSFFFLGTLKHYSPEPKIATVAKTKKKKS